MFFTDSDIAPWADLSGPVCSQADWIVPSKGKIHKPLLDFFCNNSLFLKYVFKKKSKEII